MPIPDFARKNFNTLIRAAKDDRLALMECVDAQTGAARYVLCAVNIQDGEYQMVPFGHLADSNPFDAYIPPDAEEEYALH